MFFHKTLLALCALSTSIASPLLDRKDTFAYGSTKIHGVNIGGWLVLEPWITPSLFDPYKGAAVDEYSFCQNVPDAASKLQQHWATFATLGDFQKIAGSGFNAVRIPVGYWAFQKAPGDPYIQGAAEYLEKAIGWARQTGLKVWIDLHGAPQSQNGFDNSGRRGALVWTSGNTVAATNNVIKQISQKYATAQYNDVVVGIQLLNEPMMSSLPGGRSATRGYYQDGFGIVRQTGSTGVVIHDGFDDPPSWNGFLTGQGAGGAIVDHHEYQVFRDGDNGLSYQQHADAVWGRIQQWGRGADKYVICGEWTAAMTDCTKWLNGYGRGSRYDGTYLTNYAVGSCQSKTNMAAWDQAMKTGTRNYIAAQIQAYDKYTQGWFFWNFKTESSPEWDAFKLIDAGIWPR